MILTIESFAVHTKYLRKDFIIIAYHDEFKGLRYSNLKLDEEFNEEGEKAIMKDATSLGWFSNSFSYKNISEQEY